MGNSLSPIASNCWPWGSSVRALLIFWAALCSAQTRDEWPQFRGNPQLTGVAQGARRLPEIEPGILEHFERHEHTFPDQVHARILIPGGPDGDAPAGTWDRTLGCPVASAPMASLHSRGPR